MSCAESLKSRRKALGLTQAQLAEASGVSIRLIQHYEQGQKDINKAAAITVHHLAEALCCSVPDLLILSNEPS